jgi:hydrogenase-4 component F
VWESLGWTIAVPAAATAAGALVSPTVMPWVARAVMAALLASLASLWSGHWPVPDFLAGWLYSVTATVALLSLWYSEGYVAAEMAAGAWTKATARRYWQWLFAFVGALLAVAVLPNYLWLWAAMEAATLTSVALVGVVAERQAVAAAWRYLLITEAGGLAALIGTVLVVTGSGQALGAGHLGTAVEPGRPLGMLAVGAALVLVGYGTKAGLAPFHTWLPAAHGEAPAPVSALLSGVKLAAALVVAYRLLHLAAPAFGDGWITKAWVGLGLLSLAVAAAMIGFQRDLKRLWAYSSIEHMGLISLGLGFGGIALVGAMLHIMTHAVSKSLLFQQSGNVRLYYHTSRVDAGAKGMLLRMPWTGGLTALGAAAVAGLPPLAPFWSEWLILAGGFASAFRWAAAMAAALLVAAFLGLALRLPQWLWVPGPAGRPPAPPSFRESWRLVGPGLVLAVLATAGGVGVPWMLGHPWQAFAAGLAAS